MNKGFGNAIVVIKLLLLFLVTVLHIWNSDPAEAPTVSLIINGALGVIVVLAVILMGMALQEADIDTH